MHFTAKSKPVLNLIERFAENDRSKKVDKIYAIWRANENRGYMVLIAAYLVLTCGFGYLGYLENIEQRVRGFE